VARGAHCFTSDVVSRMWRTTVESLVETMLEGVVPVDIAGVREGESTARSSLGVPRPEPLSDLLPGLGNNRDRPQSRQTEVASRTVVLSSSIEQLLQREGVDSRRPRTLPRLQNILMRRIATKRWLELNVLFPLTAASISRPACCRQDVVVATSLLLRQAEAHDLGVARRDLEIFLGPAQTEGVELPST